MGASVQGVATHRVMEVPATAQAGRCASKDVLSVVFLVAANGDVPGAFWGQ